MRIKIKYFATLAALLISKQVMAHPMLSSRVDIRILESTWLMELQLPADRLEAAINLAKKTTPTTAVKSPTSQAVRDYIERRILVHSSGVPSEKWAVSTLHIAPPTSDNKPFWKVQTKLTPPLNANENNVVLEYYVIGREIHTHETVVVLVQDELNSNTEQLPKVLSKLRAHRKKILIER